MWDENCLEAMNEACGNAPIGQVAIHDVPDVALGSCGGPRISF